jgi:hypothetical protein
VGVYDDSANYSAGEGWVSVPAGSYPSKPELTGRLNFGFNSKYKDAKNPKGSSVIRFELGNFEFKSLDYDAFTISGNKAQFLGSGEVNGVAGFKFSLIVIDGKDGADKFRIRIWDARTGETVFDNQPGDAPTADPTAIVGEGSSIVIKK